MATRIGACLLALLLHVTLGALLAGFFAGSALGEDQHAAGLDRPQIILEQAAGGTAVWVESPTPDGGLTRSLLRTTQAEVTPEASGFDPARNAGFVTWREDGTATWFAYSRDGGDGWAKGRELDERLRLRDGAVAPGEPLPATPRAYRLPPKGQVSIVQFRTISLPEWRDALEDARVELLAYFPNNAHLVRLSPEAAERVRALVFVQRIVPYHPWYRLEDRLRTWLADDDALPERARVRVMSFGWGAEAKRGIVDAASRVGAELLRNTSSGHVVELRVTRDQLRRLASNDSVMWIDRWSPPATDMDLVREDAGTNWVEDNLGYCGQGVRGEVLDSGIQDDHIDFDGRLLHGDHDTSSHGTSTYGIVFGNGDRDGDGSDKAAGHMPCAQAQGIFADYGFLEDRFAHTEELKQDPYFASFQTNSWGNARTRSYDSYSHEMDDIIWRLDIAILQSQSNAGNPDSRPQAWAKNIISVGGIKHRDTLDTSDDEWDYGASTGPAEDGRIKPDIHYWYDNIFTTTTGDDYTSSFGGTFAATPEAAGVLGLMIQMWSENVWNTDPTGSTVFERQPHFSTMKALLINNAQQYPFSGEGDDLTRMHQGWGRPSARVAKERADTSFVVDEDIALEFGGFQVYEIDVPAGETELKITMVYPDPPGTTSAAFHRINDLDLEVTSPSGEVYYGNHGLVESNYSAPGGRPNDVDTVENVFVENPEAGVWQVEISAPEINQDANPDTAEDDATFALVVTGGTSQPVQPSRGRVRMDRKTYNCDDRIGIRVQDGNAAGATVPVTIWSDSEPAGETLELTETAPDSGEYRGEISTSADPPTAGDGVLSVGDRDQITVEYVDVDDGSGGYDLPRRDTASADCQEPLITDVREQDVTDDSAGITWKTDESASSEVIWGESVPPTQSERDPRRKNDHRIDLMNLEECTIYYYEVRSEDRLGNLAVDDDNGQYHYFETYGDFGNGLQPCHAGQVTIEFETYSCAASVEFEVSDLDLNTDPDTAETTTLEVVSSTETDPELVTATETGPNTSTFGGTISTSSGPPQADGTLQVSDGDVITVTYLDADDGTGRPASSYDTAATDCHQPDVSALVVEEITDGRATIRWTTDEPADSTIEWGGTPDLGRTISRSELTTEHALTLNDLFRCDRFFFRVASTDTHGNRAEADANGVPFHFYSWLIPGLYYKADFEDEPGDWTLEGEWEVGPPQGKGGLFGSADPLEAYNNENVLGVDLSGQGIYVGDYERNSDWSAWSPEFDAGSWENLELIYHRELSVHENDEASLWIWTTDRSPLYRNEVRVDERSYRRISMDLSSADGEPSLQFEFYQGSDDVGSYAGWTIDDFILKDGSRPDFSACGGCGGAPSFEGASDALDNDACGADGVTVSWEKAASWGTGASGTYSVYRGSSPGFEPTDSNRIASGLTGLSYNDTAAPADQDLYYLARAENDESCGSGPHNGGMVDGNEVYARVTETTSQPDPGEVRDLMVEVLGRAHVRLSWPAAAHAHSYRIYRSTTPEPDGFREIAETTALDHEDLDSGADKETYFYDVRALKACGAEDN